MFQNFKVMKIQGQNFMLGFLVVWIGGFQKRNIYLYFSISPLPKKKHESRWLPYLHAHDSLSPRPLGIIIIIKVIIVIIQGHLYLVVAECVEADAGQRVVNRAVRVIEKEKSVFIDSIVLMYKGVFYSLYLFGVRKVRTLKD